MLLLLRRLLLLLLLRFVLVLDILLRDVIEIIINVETSDASCNRTATAEALVLDIAVGEALPWARYTVPEIWCMSCCFHAVRVVLVEHARTER